MRFALFLFALLLLPGSNTWAQLRLFHPKSTAPSDCETRLMQAEEAYADGKVLEALNLLEHCARHAREKFSREDGLWAMSLLAILYEATNQTPKAEKTMVALLHRYPRFEPSEEAAQYQLVSTWKKYGVKPGVEIVFGGGPLWALVKSTQSWQVAQGTPFNTHYFASPANLTPSQAYYDSLANYNGITKFFSPENGYFYNAKINVALKHNLLLNTEFSVNRYRWEEKMLVDWINEPWDTDPSRPSARATGKTNTWDYIAALRLDYLRFGAGLHWDIRPWTSKGLHPYLEAGFSFQKDFSPNQKSNNDNSISIKKSFASATFYKGIFPEGDSLPVVTQSPVVSNPDSVFVNKAYGWYSEAGLSLGRGDLSYRLGLKAGGVFGNLVNPDNRYRDPVALYNFGHIEDDLNMKWLAIQASMVYTFHYNVYSKNNH